MYPNCNRPQFADQICNVSPMRSIGRIHAGYILNVPHFSNVIALCPKWGRSIKLGTLRSHDWVHSKSDQHFPQEHIKTTFMGTFSINPTFAHWAHWSHLLSVLPMYPACAWWVFGSLSPVRTIAQRVIGSHPTRAMAAQWQLVVCSVMDAQYNSAQVKQSVV